MRLSIPNLFKLSNRKTGLDVQEELQFHIEMLEHAYIQCGISPDQAKSRALRRFGNIDRIKQQCLDIRRRNTPLRRAFKWSLVLLALSGFAIHIAAVDYKVSRIGTLLILIAVAARLLLYVRGLVPSGVVRRGVPPWAPLP